MIHLLLVDDHQMLRESLAHLLDLQPDLTVVGQAGSVADARTLLTGIDVALLDLDLPDGNGATLIREIRLANPQAVSIVLTGSMDLLDHALVIEQGAGGVLNKAVPVATIIDAIRRVHAGHLLHSPAELMSYLGLAQQRRAVEADRQRLIDQLTPREIQLLEGLAQGLTDQEIAERLFISPRTAQTQMARLHDKLGTDSRLQTLIVALRYKIVSVTS